MQTTPATFQGSSSVTFDNLDLREAILGSFTKHPLHDPEPCKRPMKKACVGSRRIPCKARGLSSVHNKETAFFTIPDDAPHGLIVNCSHPECFGTDRSFRYCIVCECPVTKRNFLKRHGHDLTHSTAQLKDEVDDKYRWVLPPPVIMSECSLLEETTARPSTTRKHSRVISFDRPSHQTTPEQRPFQDLTKEESDWLSLLRKRPHLDDTSSVLKWLKCVIDLSGRVKSAARSQSLDNMAQRNVVRHSLRMDQFIQSEDVLEAQFSTDLYDLFSVNELEPTADDVGNYNIEEADFSNGVDCQGFNFLMSCQHQV